MSRHDDIQQWAWDKAKELVGYYPKSNTFARRLHEQIAHALMAERERCAKIAEADMRTDMAKRYGHMPEFQNHRKQIAAAIRKGDI